MRHGGLCGQTQSSGGAQSLKESGGAQGVSSRERLTETWCLQGQIPPTAAPVLWKPLQSCQGSLLQLPKHSSPPPPVLPVRGPTSVNLGGGRGWLAFWGQQASN